MVLDSAKSAIVRATFSIRSYARADNPNFSIEYANNLSPCASKGQYAAARTEDVARHA